MNPISRSNEAAQLSLLERTVIDLSRTDPISSLCPKRGIANLIFGSRFEPPPLANPALEALRHYAILRRRHGPAAEVEAARDRLGKLGFGPTKLAAIDRLLTARRPEHPPPRGLPAGPSRQPVRRNPRRQFSSRSEATGVFMQYRAASFISVGIALVMSMWCGVAHAQTEPPIEAPVELPQEDGPPPDGPGEENRFAIGVGGAYMPAHHGSDKYRFQPLPAVDIKYGRFFVNFQDGIGANLIDSETVTVGAGVVMADNYRAKDAPRGIGKLPFGAGARGFVKWRLAGFEATLGGTQIFAGSTKGFVADASISRPIMVSQKLFLNPSIGTTWANEKHLNRYFGVNARQSAASGLSRYRLESGFMDVKAELGAQYRLTDSIGIGLAGGVTSLLGDAKDSPIVKKRTRPYGIFFVSYEF